MDWKTLISDLQATGLTQPQIAAICGCGQATISDLLRGEVKEPRFTLGTSLQRLHAERTQPVRKSARRQAA